METLIVLVSMILFVLIVGRNGTQRIIKFCFGIALGLMLVGLIINQL
jgi:hypothetical protein